MTRSQPPNGEQPVESTGQPFPPAQYPPPQYQPGPADTPISSPGQYGQVLPGSDMPTIALPSGQPEYSPPTADVVTPQQQSAARPNKRPTRIGAAWVALIVAAIVLIFLLIFIVQNSGPVQIRYFGFDWTMPLGVAMLFAAVAGALTAGLLGTVRILQMRKKAKQIQAGK